MIRLQSQRRPFDNIFKYGLAISSSFLVSTITSLPSYSLKLQSLGTNKTPTGFSQISGLTYSVSDNIYYGVSNDPAGKFYSITIDVTGNTFNSVSKAGTTTLKDTSGTALTNIDAEGIALSGSNIFVSTEGRYTSFTPPFLDNSTLDSPANLFIRRFNITTGNQDTATGNDLTLPNRYATSTTTTGLRNNLAFESLTISPDQSRLFSAVEAPLKEDQSLASLLSGTAKNLIRILQFNLSGGVFTAGEEYLYETEVGFGLVDLLAIDNNRLIALERKANTSGTITGIGVFELSIAGATDISANTGLIASGTAGITKVQKTSITFDIPLSTSINYEGLTFGQTLADGRPTIFFVSDNNADETAVTNFAAYAVVPFDFEPSLGFLALGSIYLGNKILKKMTKKSKEEL